MPMLLSAHPALDVTSHRPWPIPAGPYVMQMDWEELLFAHWPVPASVLRDRIPRRRKDLHDLAFTADVIFPGGLNPRIEELVQAVNPYWEIEELHMRRTDYGKTTAEWYRRMQQHEEYIRGKWGDQLYDDYDRYLATCVTAFDKHWSGDVQMKLRRIEPK